MREYAGVLCDARATVYAALSAMQPQVDFLLRSAYSRAEQEGNLVIWSEWSNVNTENPVVDELTYQVIIRAADPDALLALYAAVVAALGGAGLRRVYTSPDEYSDALGGQYSKTLRYARRVDKRTMRWID